MIPHERVAEHYYDLLPPAELATGDIWTGLPTHGMLRSPLCRGLIVSPACDLANSKAEVASFLPIVTIREWVNSSSFAPDCVSRAMDLVRTLNKALDVELPSLSRLPTQGEVQRLRSALERLGSVRNDQGRQLERLRACLRVLTPPSGGQSPGRVFDDVAEAFGAEWRNRIRERLVSNSYRTDVHFLPCDGQEPAIAAVPEHSVILLRYPTTVCVRVLETAQDASTADWKRAVADICADEPGAIHFSGERPMKMGRVRDAFLKDILSRYATLSLRLGSPDLSDNARQAYAAELGG